MAEKNKPFNDVVDHYNKIEGNAGHPSNADLKKLPKPLKYFGYFVFAFFAISFLLIFLFQLLD